MQNVTVLLKERLSSIIHPLTRPSARASEEHSAQAPQQLAAHGLSSRDGEYGRRLQDFLDTDQILTADGLLQAA